MTLRSDFIKGTDLNPKFLDGTGKPQFRPEYVHWLETKLRKTKLNLKPCPFCGEEIDISLKEKRYHGGVVEIEGDKFWFVECLPCDIRTGYCFDKDAQLFGFKDGKEYAIHRWNTRKGK